MLKMRIIAGFEVRRNFNACDRYPASCRNRIRDLTLAVRRNARGASNSAWCVRRRLTAIRRTINALTHLPH
jgi:hypothetical protein